MRSQMLFSSVGSETKNVASSLATPCDRGLSWLSMDGDCNQLWTVGRGGCGVEQYDVHGQQSRLFRGSLVGKNLNTNLALVENYRHRKQWGHSLHQQGHLSHYHVYMWGDLRSNNRASTTKRHRIVAGANPIRVREWECKSITLRHWSSSNRGHYHSTDNGLTCHKYRTQFNYKHGLWIHGRCSINRLECDKNMGQ